MQEFQIFYFHYILVISQKILSHESTEVTVKTSERMSSLQIHNMGCW